MYASVEAVAEQWRPLDSRETAVATRLLDRVSALMRRYSAGLDARVASDPDLAVVAAGVAVDAVLRVLRSMSVDDSSASAETVRMAYNSLHLTPDEIESLTGEAEDHLSSGAFTIRAFGHGPRCRQWR